MRRRLVLVLSFGFVANSVGCADAADLGYPASALEESAHKSRPSFNDAPPLVSGSSPQPRNESRAEPEIKPIYDEYVARCFVKIDGRVLVNGPCQILRTKEVSVTFELTEKPVTISYKHGRTWTATWGSRELGKVYKRGSCWGGRQVYICEYNK